MGTYIRRALDQDIESATHSLVIVITGPHRSGLNPTICIQRIVCRFYLACSDAANNFGSLCHLSRIGGKLKNTPIVCRWLLSTATSKQAQPR